MLKLKRNLLSVALASATMLVAAGVQAQTVTDGAQENQSDATQDEASTLEKVTVTGIRVGIEDAISTKKDATSIVESVSAEDIGKLPDVSIAESIARLPGISAQRVAGRAQVISVRGLSPDFATTLLNGRELVSTGEGAISQKAMTQFRGKRIAYIPQEPMSNLDPAFTIGYQLVRPMTEVLGVSKKEAKARALKLLDMVGINNPERVFKSYPHEVSGGMAQRVLIAGAVSCEPDLLIADEPTTALDVTVQAEVLDLLRDLQKRLGMGMVLVTHNFGVVADLADRVVVMQYGRVVETGEVREILRSPKEEYTQVLLSSMLEGKTPMTMLTGNAKEQ